MSGAALRKEPHKQYVSPFDCTNNITTLKSFSIRHRFS